MSVSSQSATHPATPEQIIARVERLPVSWWHVKTRIIIGVATFFDAFDALAIASVLPAIVPMWKLTPPEIGILISAGFLGQLLGTANPGRSAGGERPTPRTFKSSPGLANPVNSLSSIPPPPTCLPLPW